MTLLRCAGIVSLFLPMMWGCGPQKRVHIMPEVAQISRVAVINLADRDGKPTPESEFFTNEFVSIGFSVVERGHLQEVIKEAFTTAGYLDERSVAEWGKGLGIEAVVLHQILENAATNQDQEDFNISGWIRVVDVETGRIVMTYNTEVRTSSDNRTSAAKVYAEQVVDDIVAALKQKGIQPATARKTKIVQKVEIKKTQVNP